MYTRRIFRDIADIRSLRCETRTMEAKNGRGRRHSPRPVDVSDIYIRAQVYTIHICV